LIEIKNCKYHCSSVI